MDNKWSFPINEDDSQTGISDSGIETFREDMYSSLARETCQNSMDAKLKDKDYARIEFKLSYANQRELEDHQALIEAFRKSNTHGEQLRDAKTIEFFTRGLEVLSSEKIPILRISDFNTTGLTGSSERYGSDWVNLIKNSGISQKSGTSGGSYGIGKSAPFACTDTRTILYSTLDKNGIEASQGVSRIISFLDENDRFTTGTGYFGKGTNPIHKQLSLDPNFTREDSGTDLYLVGFKDETDWKDKVIKSILEGFLLAVYDEKLVVQVEDVLINKDSLDSLINKYKEDTDMYRAYNYYQVLTSPKTHVKRHTIKDLGDIEVLVLLEQGFHKRALISRINGMKIFDMAYISTDISFAAIVRLVDEDVNAFFRLLEPPAHDKWVAGLYEKNKSLATRRIGEVRAAVKKIVEDLGQDSISAEMDVAGLGEYLPDMEDIFDSKAEEKEEKKKQSILDIKEISATEDKPRAKVKEEIDDGQFDDGGEYAGGKPDGPPNDSDGGEGGGGTYTSGGNNQASKIKRLSLVNKRVIHMGDNLYRLLLKVEKPYKSGYFRFSIAGESSNERVVVLECITDSNFKIESKKDRINFTNNDLETDLDMMIEIDYDEPCSLEVDYYVIAQ